ADLTGGLEGGVVRAEDSVGQVDRSGAHRHGEHTLRLRDVDVDRLGLYVTAGHRDVHRVRGRPGERVRVGGLELGGDRVGTRGEAGGRELRGTAGHRHRGTQRHDVVEEL